jgi:cytidylate kinase
LTAPAGVIVTMDGPAGTGKSSVALMLAERLGLEMLDTGAMYRAAAVVAIDEGVSADDGDALAARIAEEGLAFDWSRKPPRLLLGGRDLTERIRDADVNTVVSIVARQAPLRAAMVRAQREIGGAHPRLVTEGRDQGSVVFPQAELKVYLTASPEERARRRQREEEARGVATSVEAVLQAQARRDEGDRTRPVGAMRPADDAVILETDGLSAAEVVERLVRLIEERRR